MSKALEKTYDGIIIGAGHHGLILGSYLAKAGLRILLVDRRLQYGGGLTTKEVTAPGLLSQPPLHQSFPYFRNAVVQGFGPRRPRHLHHPALRIRPGAQRRHRAGVRPRPRRDHRQCRALLQARRRDVSRLEPARRGDHRAHPHPRTLRRAAAAGRARSAAGKDRDRARFPRHQPPPAARRGAGAVRERSRQASVPVQGLAVRHLAHRHAVEDEPDGIGDPRLRSRHRLPALPGRLVQSGARADGNLHCRRRHVRAAGGDRPHSDRRRPRRRHCARRRPHRAGEELRRLHHRRASDLREH